MKEFLAKLTVGLCFALALLVWASAQLSSLIVGIVGATSSVVGTISASFAVPFLMAVAVLITLLVFFFFKPKKA